MELLCYFSLGIFPSLSEYSAANTADVVPIWAREMKVRRENPNFQGAHFILRSPARWEVFYFTIFPTDRAFSR